MKVFARKHSEPVLVIAPQAGSQEPEYSADDSKRRSSSTRWLNSHISILEHSVRRFPAIYRMPKLTAQDVTRVNQATIREGESHRVWPPSVIESFNRAQVITERKVQHYELRDRSLTKLQKTDRGQTTRIKCAGSRV